MSTPIRVLIVEDQEIIRLGLKIALDQEERLEVVAIADNGIAGVAAASEHKPDVVLMDIGLPGIDGIEAAKRIKVRDPNQHLIMFTSHVDDDSIFAALAAGADGYCSKEASSSELASAIETVYRGAIWLPPAIANRVLRTFTPASDSTTMRTNPQKCELQKSEVEILSQIVQGKSGEQIAYERRLELSTILAEMHEVIDKLSRSERTQAALTAMRNASSLDSADDKICTKCGAKFGEEVEICKYDGASLISASSDPLIGTVFADRYDILMQIGTGGMSTVYKARHKFMNSAVAIKILSSKLVPDLKSIKRFRQEAQLMSSLTHPNIVAAHDFGITSRGQIFLIMDFVDGKTLASIIAQECGLPLDKAFNIFVQLCEALDYAHRKKVIHRDLKPSNIIVSTDDDCDLVKVVDFGIAKISKNIGSESGALTTQGQVFGSPLYMSPEQCTDSPADERSDLYSLGCLMFECLTGVPPFCGANSSETIRQQVFEKAPAMNDLALRNVPSQLEQIVQKCLEKDPSARFASARQVRDELLRCRSNA